MTPHSTSRNGITLADEPAGRNATPSEAARAQHARWRPAFTVIAKLVLCFGLLGWLIASGRLDLARLAVVPFSWDIVLVVVFLLASMVLQAIRWQWLLRIQGIVAPFREILQLSWVGYFAAIFLPGGAGGDVAKAYLIARARTSGRTRAVSTVLVDRFVGLYSLLLLGCASFAWLALHDEVNPAIMSIAGFTLALTLALTAMPLVFAWRPIRGLLWHVMPRALWNSLRESWISYHGSKRAIALCLLISLVSNSLVLASLAAAADALELAVPLARIFLVGPVIVLANSLPITPGGTGVGEVTGERLFSLLGLSGGAEMMLLVRIVLVLTSLPGGLLWAAKKRPRKTPDAEGQFREQDKVDAPAALW